MNKFSRHAICNIPSSCTAQCGILQDGKCTHLSIDEIKTVLDKSNWDDEDKGETITPYLLKKLPNKDSCNYCGNKFLKDADK